jgi:DNA replication protein DnaC
VRKRLGPLLPLIPEGVSEDELSAHGVWELTQAARRAAKCSRCPAEGGACDGDHYFYGDGFTPVWQGSIRPKACDKWAAYEQRRALGRAGLPPALLEVSFDTYHPRNASQERALAHCRRYADNASKRERMILSGPTGVGKTHLAASCLQVLAKRGSVMFAYVPELMDTVRRESLQSDRRTLDRASDVDFLVLDDLGAERATEFVREQLEVLLNTRLLHHRAIIFTQNLDLDQLSQSLGNPVVRRVLQEVDDTFVEIE